MRIPCGVFALALLSSSCDAFAGYSPSLKPRVQGRSRVVRQTTTRFYLPSHSYLDSLNQPSDDDENNKKQQNIGDGGGLAAFSSGSYLDNLSSASSSPKDDRGDSSDYYIIPSPESFLHAPVWAPSSTSSSSYLRSLGNSSSRSPWENQKSNGPAPWSPPAPADPPFHPPPVNPTTVSANDTPSSVEEDDELAERSIAADSDDSEETTLEDVDTTIAAAAETKSSTQQEKEETVRKLDRLDFSSDVVYENLAGDIIEEEGIIVTPENPPNPTLEDDWAMTESVVTNIVEDEAGTVMAEEAVAEDDSVAEDAAADKEPIYLDTMDGPSPELQAPDWPPHWGDDSHFWKVEVYPTKPVEDDVPAKDTTDTKKDISPSVAEDESKSIADKTSSMKEVLAAIPPKEQVAFEPPKATVSASDTTTSQFIDEEAYADAVDKKYMQKAIDLALSSGGERGPTSAYPNPTVGAVLVAQDGTILGEGCTDYNTSNAVGAAIESTGLDVSVNATSDWVVSWPKTDELRQKLARSTLYVTLEPSTERRGTAFPPITSLIEQAGIRRVVIGSPDPVLEKEAVGAVALHEAGLEVSLGKILRKECDELIQDYAVTANSKLQRMARSFFKRFGRPLGFLHCSVVDSGNRNFGSYELAPPPDMIWKDAEDDGADDDASIISVDFTEEEYQGDMTGSPMIPYYEQVDAVIVTFPRQGNRPPGDDSVTGRLTGLKWLATHGSNLPVGVERIVVLDATDFKDLPLTNDDPNLPPGLDIEAFWSAGKHRNPTRILLRRGGNEAARIAAKAAAAAAKGAAEAAAKAAAAIEEGDAALAAEAAIECQKSAQASAEFVQKEAEAATELRYKFESKGVLVETIEGGEPIDIMKHLGERNGLHSVVWRAGCWGERGVRAILDGAFQWVSAHLAVDAVGGKFWQLMMAENAVQAACGPQSKVKIFSDEDDISLEYCDEPDVDKDCALSIDGRPVRHVRLDCRVALVDENRPREFSVAKTQKINRKFSR